MPDQMPRDPRGGARGRLDEVGGGSILGAGAPRLRLGPAQEGLSDPFVQSWVFCDLTATLLELHSFPFSPQSLLYKKVNEAQYRSHLANEMMMYHMKVRLARRFCPPSQGLKVLCLLESSWAQDQAVLSDHPLSTIRR